METDQTTDRVTTIDNENAVAYNSINANKGNISYVLSSGEFIIGETSFYLVN